MPTVKDVSEYPLEYGNAFLQACREPVSVPCESEDEASLLRSRLYAFRRAVWEQPYILPKVTLVASLVKFRLDGPTLILEGKNITEDRVSEALRKSIRRPTSPDLSTLPRQHDADDSEDVPGEVPA